MDGRFTILVVDDDRNICELIRLYMVKEGYDVLIECDGNSAVETCRRENPDLMILDVMLPGLDGWQVLTAVRQFSRIPVIMLSAKGEVVDKVLGLELGADDYMTKPFDSKELVARVRARIRRAEEPESRQNPDDEVIRLPHLVLNKSTREARLFDKVLDLAPREFDLLYFMASNPNRVYTREQLLVNVWGYDYLGNSKTVDVHIKRVRDKLKPDCDEWRLNTIWAVGYKFEVKGRV